MNTVRIASIALIGQLALAGAAWADGMSTPMDDESGGNFTMMEPASGTTSAGAAESLSPGNRKIADALFESQTIPPSGQEAWSFDQIAAAKQSGEGWGEIFHELKSEGLIQAKNLGQVVSGHYQPSASESGGTTVVITNAAGETSGVAEINGARRGRGESGRGGRSDSTAGLTHGRGARRAALDEGVDITTTGGGMAAAGMVHGGGNAYGHVSGGAGNHALETSAGSVAAGDGATAGAIHGGGYGRGHVR